MPYCSRHWQMVAYLKQLVSLSFIFFNKLNFLFQEVKCCGFPDKVILAWFRPTKWKFGLVGTYWTCRNSTRTGWSAGPVLSGVLSSPGVLPLSCVRANSTSSGVCFVHIIPYCKYERNCQFVLRSFLYEILFTPSVKGSFNTMYIEAFSVHEKKRLPINWLCKKMMVDAEGC